MSEKFFIAHTRGHGFYFRHPEYQKLSGFRVRHVEATAFNTVEAAQAAIDEDELKLVGIAPFSAEAIEAAAVKRADDLAVHESRVALKAEHEAEAKARAEALDAEERALEAKLDR